MEDSDVRTVSERRALRPLGLLLVFALASGCAGRYKAPRRLAGFGTAAVAAGGVTWATGQGLERNGHSGAALVTSGFVSVAVGLAAVVVAGGWMAVQVACNVDPDCDEEEQCREIPAPPGGVPYKQCMSR
jgi:acetyl-CoA acetyltransferase